MKKMIIMGGSKISGAEIVLKDYILKTKNKFELLTSYENSESSYYNLNNINIIGKKELSAIGADKSFVKKIIKLFNLFKITLFINNIIKKQKIELIITNNTIDILYLTMLKNKRVQSLSFIHDILEKSSIQSRIILKNDNKIKKYIAVSQACKRALLNLGISKDKIEVIYNGIEIKENTSNEKIENSFIFIGMIDEIKNPLEYIEFMEKISKSFKEYTGKVVYKYADQDLLKKMKKRVEEKKLNIEFSENLSRKEVDKLLEKTKYLFICSKKDTLPTVVLEAMNNSVFVIGKNIDGIPEMVSNENGILYSNKKEFDQIIEKIKKMNSIEYKEKILKSKELLEAKFCNKIKAKKIDKLIEEVYKS